MATYEYKCSNGHEYIEVRSMTEDQKKTECDECGEKLNRSFSGSVPSVVFKGSGFYSTGG
jgi:putative FmdB family regulatory protein